MPWSDVLELLHFFLVMILVLALPFVAFAFCFSFWLSMTWLWEQGANYGHHLIRRCKRQMAQRGHQKSSSEAWYIEEARRELETTLK